MFYRSGFICVRSESKNPRSDCSGERYDSKGFLDFGIILNSLVEFIAKLHSFISLVFEFFVI